MNKCLNAKSLSDQLQAKDIDLAAAVDLVSATKDVLAEYRSDEQWAEVYEQMNRLTDACDIGIRQMEVRERNTPRRLDSYVVTETTGGHRRLHRNSKSIYKAVYFAVLDVFVSELN